MNFLIDIGHPAHVHYYRNLAIGLSQMGHNIIWTVRDIEVAIELLKFYGFTFKILPKKLDALAGKLIRQIQYSYIILREIKAHKIDIAFGTSVSITHVARVAGIYSIVFDDDDDDVQPLVSLFSNPFASCLLSPDTLLGKRRRKDTIYYPGYHELAYLHPSFFKPDPSVLTELGLNPNESFFILRFNAFKAHHDIGNRGLSMNQKLQIIEILKPHGKILITTEREIEPDLKKYQLKMKPHKLHSLMSYATILIGDSQTMTSEAAVLGIPSIRMNSFAGRISYLEEEEQKYKLTYSFEPNDFATLIEKLKELLLIPDLQLLYQERRQKLLSDKINVTAFWIWFLDNFPSSKKIISENPRIYSQFK